MKRLLLTASLLGMPMVSFADDPEPSGRVAGVDLEYWGTLENCSIGDCSGLPDVLHGLLQVDLFRAPRDLNADPLFGHYQSRDNAFVTRPGLELQGRSADLVVVADRNPLAAEAYSVQDHADIYDGDELVNEQALEVGLRAPRDWGVEGDSIVQDFDVRPAEIEGAEGFGVFQQLINGVRLGYSFVVDRLRVTPRFCSR